MCSVKLYSTSPLPAMQIIKIVCLSSLLSSSTSFKLLSSVGNARSTCGRLFNVWSDNRATREYQSFLEGTLPPFTLDIPSLFINSPASTPTLLHLQNPDDITVSITDEFPSTISGNDRFPIYVTLPPSELNNFLTTISLTPEQLEDLVFFSDSVIIESILRVHGLIGTDQTQAVLGVTLSDTVRKRFSTTAVKLDDVDSMNEEKWAGGGSVCGKWAGSIIRRTYSKLDVTAEFLEDEELGDNKKPIRHNFYREWRRVMFERAIGSMAVDLVGASHVKSSGGDSLDRKSVTNNHADEIVDLARELAAGLRQTMSVSLLTNFEERVIETVSMSDGMSELINPDPTADINYDNKLGFFVEIQKKFLTIASEKSDVAGVMSIQIFPLLCEYLGYLKGDEYLLEIGAVAEEEEAYVIKPRAW